MMRIALVCLVLSLFISASASAQNVKSPYAPKTVAELEAQNAYYADATVVFHQPDGAVVTKNFSELSDAERANMPGPVPPAERQRVAQMPPLTAGTKVHVSSAGRVRIERKR